MICGRDGLSFAYGRRGVLSLLLSRRLGCRGSQRIFYLLGPVGEFLNLLVDGWIHVLQDGVMREYAEENCTSQQHATDQSLTQRAGRLGFLMRSLVLGTQVNTLYTPKDVGSRQDYHGS